MQDQARVDSEMGRRPIVAAITLGTRFLAYVATNRPVFTDAAITACTASTYIRCQAMTEERVDSVCAARLSPAARSETWNTFCVSTVPYPASIVPISRDITTVLRRKLWQPFPSSSWIQQSLITDLGMLLELLGVPRDPGLVADTASIMACARGGLAGPEQSHGRIVQDINAIRAWAQNYAANPPDCALPTRREQRAVRTLLQLDPDLPHLGRGPGIARAVYTALWSMRCRANAHAYVLRRSRLRRWRPI